MNRFIARNRDDRPFNEKNNELKDEDRLKVARDREERLQRSIQSTLKSLGKRVDSSHRKIDDRRSLARPNSRGRPEKPNKYWQASMQKQQAPAGKRIASKIGFDEDSPRATNFPDLEDFLGRAPDDKDQMNGSPPLKTSGGKSNTFGLSPISSEYKEDDNKSAEVIQLNQDKNEDSMDFDDAEEQNSEPQLTVNLTNLLGGSTPDQAQNVTNQSERQSEKPRESNKQNKRASQLGRDQYGSTLFDFFKSLDYTPGATNNQGTVRASYKAGRGSYNLYGVPGTKPGDKGKVFIQSQDGFDKDLPPVRLSDKQRDQLINNFQELERLTSQDDQSENDVKDDETPQKNGIPTTPNIPSKSKDNILKNNKTFWSSGIENSKPLNIPQMGQKKPQEKQFQFEYNRLMGYEETVTPGGGMETPQTPEMEEQETPGGPSANKSIFQTVYSGMLSSIYGGFGGFNGSTPSGPEDLPNDLKPTLKQNEQPLVVPINKLFDHQRAPRALSPGDEWKKPQKLPPTRDKSPMLGLNMKPNHHRFNRKPEAQGAKDADPFQQPPVQQQQPPEPENSLKSFQTGSGSLRKARQPLVMKLTSEDFDSKAPSLDITPTSQQQKSKTPAESLYKYHDPYAPQPQSQQTEDMDPSMPNVIILVADNVKLIRNNAVPMLQVQVEIIQSAMNYDSDMCMLGLNDVIYIVPEFTVSEYDIIYSRICTGEEYYEFKNFFDHYANYRYNPQNDSANLPERMVGLNKNCMIAIDRDHYEPDLRGKAFINLKNVPNGHYTIFYLRIGQPISINSRLKVLGKSKHIYVNINREKIVICKKPQLDLNHSSSRISRRETSKFKIMKAQQTKKRDNKILSLNSDDEGEGEEQEQPLQQILEKKADDELKKLKSSEGTRDDSKEDPGLDMEFDDESGPNQGKKSSGSGTPTKVQPPPLQNSKEYYNSTQRMTEAMIQNPQFQIFSIDEEESVRTSMRESVEYRQSIDSIKGYPLIPDKSEDDVYVPNTPNMPTPLPDAPEDAFRNIHRQPNDDYSVTNDNLPRPSTKDQLSKQIEDYQKNSLAQLASFMASEPTPSVSSSRKVQTPSQQEQYKPPQVPEVIPPLQIAPQRSNNEFHSRRDSVKSGRSNTSMGSKRGTRIKTISLKELEDPEPKPKTPWQPGQPRVMSPERSRSSSQNDGQQRRITEIQIKQRSSSSKKGGRGSYQEEDPFQQDMRETIKQNPKFLHQQMSARPNSRGGRSESMGSARSNQSNEGGQRRPWAKNTGDSRPAAQQRSKSRPQGGSKPFPGNMMNQNVAQTPTEKMFDRYGNQLNQPEEDMRPKSQAQPQAYEADNSLRSPSRGQDSGRNRFFRQRSTSQGSNSSTGRRRQPLSNTYLGQKQKTNQQFNENFSDDGSPARADMIQTQQERKMGRGKRF